MQNVLNSIQIVLCNTSHPGNIGSAARAMKTMGMTRLTLVAPLVRPDDHSLALACSASDVVLNARIVDSLSEALADSVVTVAMSGRKREFSNQLATPKEIVPALLASAAANQQVSIVFGNEQHGLTIEQQESCQRLVTIPGNPEYFSLNLAQAVQIMCYELYSSYQPNVAHLINPAQKANHGDNEYLLRSLDEIMQQTNYYHKKNSSRILRRCQQILHKADLEREEADLLHGILKQIKWSLPT